MFRYLLPLLLLIPDGPSGRARDQKALEPFASLIGEWKGTGQVRRGSTRGAWRESGAWSWSLTTDSAALTFDLSDGKHLKSARLRPSPSGESGRFELEATLADGSIRRYSGSIGEGKALTLTPIETTASEGPVRLTLTPLHDTRFLLRFEVRGTRPGTYQQLGEVGYTRQGVAFATGTDGPVCIVTGGRGTIDVVHEGKTYKVCCSGCRDLFNDDPEGTLAEARAEGWIK